MDPQAHPHSGETFPPDATRIAAAGSKSTAARLAALSNEAALNDLEQERLAALHNLAILDTQAEQQYDDLTTLASYVCGTPMALISLVDEDRQWFKSRVGVEVESTPRSESVCAYTIQQSGLFIVKDATQDDRFCSMPMVASGEFRFYAGAPIATVDGHKIGSLCVLDEKPRELTEEQKRALLVLSRSATAYLSVRGQIHQLLKNADERRAIELQLRENHSLLEEANRQLQMLAATDALTGLPNRRVLEASLNEQQHGPVTPGKVFSLLMIDVDHFKRVNDTYSHETGDLVLKRVAGLLRSSVRESDTVSRYGGEEFVVLLQGASEAVAMAQAERLRTTVANDPKATVPITISIGVATAKSDSWHRDLSTLLADADKALYAAKHGGRNCVRSANAVASHPEQGAA